jgi:hypothetical protein
MVLTCIRNVGWSQCHALNPGQFLARTENGHIEVQALSGKGKGDWVKFDVVQQTALSRPHTQELPLQEAPASIEPPKSGTSDANSGFSTRWKSLAIRSVRTLRFEGDYIYGEVVFPESAVKAGTFALMEAKKDGDKYVGKTNARLVRADGGASCSETWPIEFTSVASDRIGNARSSVETSGSGASHSTTPFFF